MELPTYAFGSNFAFVVAARKKNICPLDSSNFTDTLLCVTKRRETPNKIVKVL